MLILEGGRRGRTVTTDPSTIVTDLENDLFLENESHQEKPKASLI